LSRQFHLEPCYDEYFRECDYSRNGFRLPSEAEWEYACRAGTTTRYYSGDTEIDLARAAWYRGNSRQQTQPAGRKEPNAFGLYDMSGNVFEWCNDWFVPYSPEPVRNPTGIRRGSNRVLRGGSWYNSSSVCRSAFRHFGDPDNRRAYVGFRIVRGVK
jgi:formylglycine-generating enzyme required for sulfatase activity